MIIYYTWVGRQVVVGRLVGWVGCVGESGSFRPWVVTAGSFRPWVVSAGSFRSGSFRPYFGVSRFGLFWWVVSAVSHFGRGSFRPV